MTISKKQIEEINKSVSIMKLVYLNESKINLSVNSSQTSFDALKNLIPKDEIQLREFFYVLLLNRAGDVLGAVKISEGTTAGTVVDVKFIAASAILSNASSAIIAHNHPSGVLRPSEEDKKTTDKIKNALKLVDVVLFDHLILTKDNYYSFADNGII